MAHGIRGCVLQTHGLHSKTLWLFVQCCKLFVAIIFLFKNKEGQAQHRSTFQRMNCFISPKCSGASEENVAVVLLKNNKSYGIPLNLANVGNIGRKDREHFKVLV